MRRALRLLRQNPAFTILVISILALTIGACTSIFTLVNAILLKPLPFEDSSRLLVVTAVAKGDEASLGCLTWPRFNQIAGQNRTFAGFAAFTSDTLNLSGTGEPEQLQAARVSWNFFEVLGIRPVLGRTFRALDGTASGEPVVLISDSLWSRKFASAPGVVGQTINLGTRAYTVAGVLPPGFSFGLLPSRVEVWVPRIDELSLMSSEHLRSGVCYLNAVARRAAGVPSNGPSSEMAVLAAQYAHAYAKLPDAHHVVKVEPLQQEMSGGFRPILLVLAGAVALVLLIGCANVSSLLLARALARQQEIAVRRALGATSADLIRMSLFESLAIALTGGALGTMLSFLTVRLAAARLAQFLPRSEELATGINGAVLVFALSVSLLTGLLFGLAPALQFSRMAGRGTVGSRQGNRIRNLLVTAQLALSVVLLVCAGLLMRTFIHLVTLPPGFQPGHTLTMTLAVSPATYSTGAQLVNFYEQVLDRIRPLPGVQAVAASSALPVNPARASPVLVEGQAQLPLAERPIVYVQTFLHDYLRALGIPLLRGRAFDAHDRQDSPPVVMINQAFAHQFFPGQNAIGRHVWLGRSTRSAEIVGILADIKNVTLSVPAAPEIDLPFAQLPWPSMNITVRSSASAGALANAIRQQIAAVDPTQPVTNLQTLDDVLASARSQPRVMMVLLGAFAAAAFLLALVGLYGVMNYSVGQRYQEMAVRMALGAGTQNLIRLIVGQGLALASIGAAIGLAASFAVTRLLATLLYGVTPTDALTFFGSPLLLLLFAAIASGIPALRAARVDPAEALRNTP